jgi:hypothetical protein
MHHRWLAASRESGQKSTGASWFVFISLMTSMMMMPYSIPQMTSIRHGVRVLQHADITQHDWHAGQILCHLPPSGSQAHTVFIDFAATTQTLDLDVDLSNSKDDYGLCVVAITTSVRKDVTGMDTKWVCEYWDRDEMKRECWDANMMGLVQKEYSWKAHAVDPYKFVYDGLEPELDNNMFNV